MAITIATSKCLSFFSINTKSKSPPQIPIFISTDTSEIDLRRLSSLYSSCNHSLHRFPDVTKPQPAADLRKLGVAVAHSSIVVSVFTKPENADGGSWGAIWSPLSPENGRLVGFGRAVSDLGLTASIYDVMVLPGLRRMGIGRLIVERIVRMLTNRGVYDISALCSEQESLFFKTCGFGDDVLGSTTMMYGRSGSSNSQSDLIVKAGRRIILAPPLRLPFNSDKT